MTDTVGARSSVLGAARCFPVLPGTARITLIRNWLKGTVTLEGFNNHSVVIKQNGYSEIPSGV